MSAPKVGETTKDMSLLGRRDAFHFPGILVSSPYYIDPGSSVAFLDAARTQVRKCEPEFRQAVVDPHVKDDEIEPGVLFWVFLEPGLVTNLVHTFEVNIEGVEERGRVDPSSAGFDDDEEYSCKGCYD